MKSTAATPAAYLASLPEDRRAALDSVRKVIRASLDMATFEETMLYGVLAYVVPHRVYPPGHHTNPKLPLMYMGLSSQKNDMVVYMLMLLHNEPERKWFDGAWKATGRKNYLEVTGMGCCLRFKKLEELSLDVIGEAIRRMPVKKYLQDHAAMLKRIGKAPKGRATSTPAPKVAKKSGAAAKRRATPAKRK